MNRFTHAFDNAMQQSKGRFPKAAAILAEDMEFDDALRVEAALVLLASMMQPGRDELERAFELDTGKTLDEFVDGFLPAALKLMDEMEEVRDEDTAWIQDQLRKRGDGE